MRMCAPHLHSGRCRSGGGETSIFWEQKDIGYMDLLLQTIVGGLLGGGFVGFLEFLIKRKDEKDDKKDEILSKLDAISKKISDIEEQMEKDKADNARRNILLFDDELRRAVPHSEESYNNILESVNFYQQYCIDNPKYENSKAVNAIENINQVYQKVKHDDLFI